MIQVFFNNKSIIFFADSDMSVDKSGFCAKYFLVHPSDTQTRCLFQLLQNEDCMQIGVVCHDVDKSFALFRSLFVNIDAAGGLISNANGEYLVIDRRGYIDLPKGKKEAGESDEQNALREVEEETGLTGVRIISRFPNSYHIYKLVDGYALKCTHWYKMAVDGCPNLTPQTEEDIVSAMWVNKDDFKKLADRTYLSLKGIFKIVADED